MRATAIALLAVLLLTALPTAPLAREEGRTVAVEVISIAASTEEAEALAVGERRSPAAAGVAPELSRFSKKLRALFAYNRYLFLSRGRAKAELGGESTFQLPGNFSLEVEPVRVDEEAGLIEMVVTLVRELPPSPAAERSESTREIILRTRIKLGNGGTVLLGGPPIDGGVLILALSAKG